MQINDFKKPLVKKSRFPTTNESITKSQRNWDKSITSFKNKLVDEIRETLNHVNPKIRAFVFSIALVGLLVGVFSIDTRAAISQVQKKSSTSTSTTVSAVFDSSPTENNLLIATIFTRATSITTPSGWSVAQKVTNSSENDEGGIYYKVAGSSESSTVSFTVSETDTSAIGIYEYSGMTTTGTLDVTATTGRTTSVTSLSSGTTATTAQADELAIAMWGIRDDEGGGTSYTNSYSEEYDIISGGGAQAALLSATKTLSATGTTSSTASWTNSVTAMGVVATFKASGVTKVQEASNNCASCTSVAATLSSAPVSGNVLIAVVFARGSEPVSISTSGWTLIETNNDGTNDDTMEMWYRVADGTEGSSYVVTGSITSDAGQSVIWASEWSGFSSAELHVSAKSTAGDATTRTSGTTGSTTSSNAWAIASFSSRSPHNTTGFSNSFTETFDSTYGTGTTASGLHVADKNLSSTGTQETTATFDSSNRSMGIIAVFTLSSTLIDLAKLTQEGYIFENDDGFGEYFGIGGVADALDPSSVNITVSKPTGITEGDFMIAVQASDYNATEPTFTTLSGWTLIGDVWGSVGGTKTAVYYKVAGDSEPLTYTWTMSGNIHHQIMIFEVDGVDGSDPVDVSGFSADESFNTSLDTPSVTPTINNGILISGATSPSGSNITVPGGMTLINDYNGDGEIQNTSVAYEELTSSAATGTNTFTDTTSVRSTGFQIVFNRDSGPGTSVAGSEFSSGKTLSTVRKGERVNLRTQITNNGYGALEGSDELALFYDRNDGIWSKVSSGVAPSTSAGNCTDTDWDCLTVDNTGTNKGQWTSSALDSSGRPWVSYYDVTSTALVVAQFVGTGGTGCTSSAWTCTTVDNTGTNKGSYTSIAFDNAGKAWVSYYDVTGTRLRVAQYVRSGGSGCTSSAWTCEDVDNTGTNTGQYTSIAFDTNNKPWVSYYDVTNTALRIAHRDTTGFGSTCTDADWRCGAIDADASSDGTYTSLAFDYAGNPWVSYYDATATALMVAQWVGADGAGCGGSPAEWTCETVDNTATATGQYSSIAFSPGNTPWVSYYDSGSADLKVAHRATTGFGSTCTDADWRCGTVESSGTVGLWTSLAFAPDGSPWVSYYDNDGTATNKALKYTRFVGSGGSGCADSAWTGCNDVDSNGADAIGEYSSLLFAQDGTAHIAYYDGGSETSMKIAKISRSGEIMTSPSSVDQSGNVLTTSHSDMTSSSDSTNRDDSDCLAGSTTWNSGKHSNVANLTGVVLGRGSVNKQCTEVSWTLDTTQAVPGTTYRFIVATKDANIPGKGPWRGPIAVATDGYPTLSIGQSDQTTYRYSKNSIKMFGSDCISDSEWVCDDIDTSVTSGNYFASTPSIAFNPADGEPWVAFFEGTVNDNLIVARYVGTGGTGCTNSAWDCTDVDTNEAGEFTSIGFDPSGTAWVSSRANGAGDLRVAKYVGSGGTGCATATWDCTDILTTDDVGYFSDIEFDKAGNPWIYYENATQSDASVAHYVGGGKGTGCDDTDWTCEAIDSTGDPGAYGALAMSPDGVPWVAFAEQTGDDLVAARWVGSGGTGCSNPAWTCYDVDVTNQVVDYTPDIGFNSSGQAVIAYHYWTGQDLRFATFVGSGGDCDSLYGGSDAWACTVVKTAGTIEPGSMAMDSDGNPWISYRDGGNDELQYARYVGSGGTGCATSAWDNCSAIDSVWGGVNSEIAFDVSGTPWIVAYDATGEINIAKMKYPPGSPSAENPVTVGGRNSGSGDLLHHLTSGLAPYTDPYGTCGGLANALGYCGVYSSDGQYDSIIAGTNESPMYSFSTRYGTNTELPTANVTFLTSVSPAAQNVKLQVYRYGSTNTWEDVSTYSTAGCTGTDNCSISVLPSGTPSEYYESDSGEYWVHFRLYQVKGASSTTLYIDSINANQPKSRLRGGRVFRDTTSDPLGW